MSSRFSQNVLLTGARLPSFGDKGLLDEYCVGCDTHIEEVNDYVVVDGHPVCLDCFDHDTPRKPDHWDECYWVDKEEEWADRFETKRGEW